MKTYQISVNYAKWLMTFSRPFSHLVIEGQLNEAAVPLKQLRKIIATVVKKDNKHDSQYLLDLFIDADAELFGVHVCDSDGLVDESFSFPFPSPSAKDKVGVLPIGYSEPEEEEEEAEKVFELFVYQTVDGIKCLGSKFYESTKGMPAGEGYVELVVMKNETQVCESSVIRSDNLRKLATVFKKDLVYWGFLGANGLSLHFGLNLNGTFANTRHVAILENATNHGVVARYTPKMVITIC